MQAPHAPASMRHWKVAPASPVKARLAEVDVIVPLGPALMPGAAGAVVSTVHVRVVVAPVLPAASVARTSKLWAPSVRPV